MNIKKVVLAIAVFIVSSSNFLSANSGFSSLYSQTAGLCQGAVSWVANNQKSSAVIGVALLAGVATSLWYWYRHDSKRKKSDGSSYMSPGSIRVLDLLDGKKT